VLALEKQVKQLSRGKRKADVESATEQSEVKVRFSAQRLAAHRSKLGLSAKDYGMLVGVSSLTIYKWESGNVRPRDGQLQAIAAVRKLGKREAAARLEELSA